MADEINRFLQDVAGGTTTRIHAVPFLIGLDERGAVVLGKPGKTTLVALTLDGGEIVAEALSPDHLLRINGNPVQRMIVLDGDALDVGGKTWLLGAARPQAARTDFDPDRTQGFESNDALAKERAADDESDDGPPTVILAAATRSAERASRDRAKLIGAIAAVLVAGVLLLAGSLWLKESRVVEVATTTSRSNAPDPEVAAAPPASPTSTQKSEDSPAGESEIPDPLPQPDPAMPSAATAEPAPAPARRRAPEAKKAPPTAIAKAEPTTAPPAAPPPAVVTPSTSATAKSDQTSCAGVAAPITDAEREAEAQCLFRLGYRIEAVNRQQARHYFEQALAVAPPDSRYRRAAQTRLAQTQETRP